MLGMAIRRRRLVAGLTQADLAGPFSAAYVSAIERSRIVPSLPALILLAERMGTTASELLVGVKSLEPMGYTPSDGPDHSRSRRGRSPARASHGGSHTRGSLARGFDPGRTG